MANVDILSTHRLLMAVQQLTPATTFLRDRYFPTNDATDVFATEDVLVEYRDGSRRLAPFVAPRKEGVTVLRKGYELQRFTPPYIAPQRPLTIDDVNKRGFGEALFTELTPEQRETTFAMLDAEELSELISRREEAMAAEVMTTGGCVMKHIGDDVDNPEEFEVRFYTGVSNPYVYTPTRDWDDADASIYEDIYAMIQTRAEKGLPSVDLVCSPDVAGYILHNKEIKELLDIRRYELGSIAPTELPAGASVAGVLNVYGSNINIISYGETYEADNGAETPFLPVGTCVLTAPAAGRTLYGAVTQVEEDDKRFHTYTGKRIPKHVASAENNSRTLTMKSRPLLIPNSKGAFLCATVKS